MPSGDISSEPARYAFPGESGNLTPLQVFVNGDPTDLEPGSDRIDPNNQNIRVLELDACRIEPEMTNSSDPFNLEEIFRLEDKVNRMREFVSRWSMHREASEEIAGEEQTQNLTSPQGADFAAFNIESLIGFDTSESHTENLASTQGFEPFDSDTENPASTQRFVPFDSDTESLMSIFDSYTENPTSTQRFVPFDSDTESLMSVFDSYTENPASTQGFEPFYSDTESLMSIFDSYTENPASTQGFEPFDSDLESLMSTAELDISELELDSELYIENPTSTQGFDNPVSITKSLISQQDQALYEIYVILKETCGIHNIPLAQTWAVSAHSSFVSHGKLIQKSCCSFNTPCVGKVCMSGLALPFHVKDPAMWDFREACRQQHLDMSRGILGKALLSRGSCFCGDVTKLGEEEYPLVQHAHMNGLSSCFAIFLHNVEADDDYVLEFFLTPDIKESGDVVNLVQTLKQKIEIVSGFELGDSSCIRVVEPPIQIASITTTNNNQFQTVMKMCDNVTDAGEKNNHRKQNRKRKGSLTMEAVKAHFGKSLVQASEILGVSRSTLKRFCRVHNMPRWPRNSDKHVRNTIFQPSQSSWPKQNLQRPSNIRFGLSNAVFLMIRIKRWSCSIKSHGFSGKWWSCGRHSYLPSKSDCIYQAARLSLLPVQLRQLRKNSMKNAVRESTVKHTVAGNSVRKMVTVKAIFGEDTIRFQFPTSSGLSELEHEVARRFELKTRSPYLKYTDEENDLILLTCDDDLYDLLGRDDHNKIRLIVS